MTEITSDRRCKALEAANSSTLVFLAGYSPRNWTLYSNRLQASDLIQIVARA
jgi:hypothetical protein